MIIIDTTPGDVNVLIHEYPWNDGYGPSPPPLQKPNQTIQPQDENKVVNQCAALEIILSVCQSIYVHIYGCQ